MCSNSKQGIILNFDIFADLIFYKCNGLPIFPYWFQMTLISMYRSNKQLLFPATKNCHVRLITDYWQVKVTTTTKIDMISSCIWHVLIFHIVLFSFLDKKCSMCLFITRKLYVFIKFRKVLVLLKWFVQIIADWEIFEIIFNFHIMPYDRHSYFSVVSYRLNH